MAPSRRIAPRRDFSYAPCGASSLFCSGRERVYEYNCQRLLAPRLKRDRLEERDLALLIVSASIRTSFATQYDDGEMKSRDLSLCTDFRTLCFRVCFPSSHSCTCIQKIQKKKYKKGKTMPSPSLSLTENQGVMCLEAVALSPSLEVSHWSESP